MLIPGAAPAQAPANLVQGLAQALVVDGFEQVIHRFDGEGVDGISVVGGDEQNRRQGFGFQGADYVEAVHAGHLDVEEDEIRAEFPNLFHRLATVAGLAEDFETVR